MDLPLKLQYIIFILIYVRLLLYPTLNTTTNIDFHF